MDKKADEAMNALAVVLVAIYYGMFALFIAVYPHNIYVWLAFILFFGIKRGVNCMMALMLMAGPEAPEKLAHMIQTALQ